MSRTMLRLALTCAICATLVGTSACSATFGQVRMPGEIARQQKAQQSPAAPTRAAALEGFSDDDQLRIAIVQPIVEREASAQGLDPELVNAVIWVESRFRPEAKSSAGARGLMQLMPATASHLAKQLGERRPKAHDPEFNIKAGTYYLSRLMERFDGDETLAIAAYNAGPGNVAKWQAQGSPLPEYSQSYVAKVTEARARFGQHATQSATIAPAMPMPAQSDVVLVRAEGQDPATTGSGSVMTPIDALADGGLIPEPPADPTFDTPVFELAPQLDREDVVAGPAHRVAVTAASGAWPGKFVPAPKVAPAPTAEAEVDADSEADTDAATDAATATDADQAPQEAAGGNADLPPPPVEPEIGAGVLPDLHAPRSAP